ncbi:GntR family transcriptional regulator [Telmatospirillum sp.]|uniref:GntR family transcriptional regulator n=1 Tax=Telmatospirillum sp. TaxID=2079197 RepID=UPI0028493B35|nr:GntR family transcriptional regulator [Telmatospirillum sp.]MDR3438112.1 GntR family transcriptional regulator [Telmatospirillum sp.]
MNAGQTSARVYEALRRRLMERAYTPGARLDPQLIADELASSTTPVRDALHVLAGEELVQLGPHGGFACAMIDEPGLVDLYAWSSAVLNLALRDRKRVMAAPVEAKGEISSESLAVRARELFQAMADASANIEHGRAMRRINARLHGARLTEATIFQDATEELDDIAQCYAAHDLPDLRRRLGRYWRRRRLVAARVVRQLYRTSTSRDG